MEKYTPEIQTLSKLADKVDGKINRSMSKRIAPRIHKAGSDFLDKIHEECKGKIGACERDLEEESRLIQLSASEFVKRPELTPEYLKSIDREDMLTW